MAVAIATKVDPTWNGYGDSTNYTISFPSGLEVGDLMIAAVCSIELDESPIPNVDTPTGWTEILSSSVGSGNMRLEVFGKIATSDDVSAGSVSAGTGIGGSDNAFIAVSCFRITGHSGLAAIQDNSLGILSDATPDYTIGLTPIVPDCLYLFFVGATGSGSSASVAGYAMATDNPSWTEQFDVFAASDSYAGPGQNDGLFSCASATRTQITSTGNLSCTLTNFLQSVGALVIILPVTNVTVSPAVIPMTASVQAPTVTGGANVSPAVITMTASVQAPTVVAGEAEWTNTDKSSAPSWTNLDKS